jgi:hypothetical protein
METKEPKQDGNLSNNTYNLMEQLIEENQSLWRIKINYLKDAEGDLEASEFWKYLQEDKQDHIKKLTKLVSKLLQNEVGGV